MINLKGIREQEKMFKTRTHERLIKEGISKEDITHKISENYTLIQELKNQFKLTPSADVDTLEYLKGEIHELNLEIDELLYEMSTFED